MKDINFQLECVNAELPAVLLDNGTWLFHAHKVCEFADVTTKTNENRWVKENIPLKWTEEFRRFDQVGRPATYLKLPGFLYTLTVGNSEIALDFRNEVYENILPSIIEKGGYISPTATSEQMTVMQSQLDIQQSMILEMGRELTDLKSKKKEFETNKGDWETDINNDANGNPLTYYTFLRNERISYIEERSKWKSEIAGLEVQAKQLEAVKKAILKLKPTKTIQPLLKFVTE
jgi:prophage antirepressor-like protein